MTAAPRSAVFTAHLIPLILLPSGVWRIVLGCGVSMGFSQASLDDQGFPGRGTLMVVFLTALTEGLALLSLGLVRPWGEVVPGWVPRLHGRRIPAGPVIAAATVGGVLLSAIWAFALHGLLTGEMDEISGRGWHALVIACYLPAILWGPLLLWLTHQYRRRRLSASPAPMPTTRLGAWPCP
ncbi:hypothetical protein SAMN04487968_10753 [Nocardioides terrae]|uniref:Uncharacterized protein n=1 Tax=Nocardioides terrae TaxID=574651 RepID=A0A1I1JUW1_9ACTN|nr:hypothetical protein [Nocardioides terrae]SFC49150.1 hypothetical protein SAMN04487968_10753 [Nocardioides terrae]